MIQKLNVDVYSGINIKNEDIKNNMKKLFIIHKNKYIFYENLKYFDKIIKIMNDIEEDKKIDQLIDNVADSDNFNLINIDEEENKNNNILDITLLDNLDNFLKETFTKIDPLNELAEFKISLQNLRESIIGRKIRITFIGNINVGKSTVLNTIIGKEILPVNDKECTYRGIIIRHVNKKQPFKLLLKQY